MNPIRTARAIPAGGEPGQVRFWQNRGRGNLPIHPISNLSRFRTLAIRSLRKLGGPAQGFTKTAILRQILVSSMTGTVHVSIIFTHKKPR